MSEHLHPNHSSEKLQPIDTAAHAERLKQSLEKSAEAVDGAVHIESIRDAVEAAAEPSEAAARLSEQSSDNNKSQPSWYGKELQLNAYKEILRKTRRHLTKSEKTLSKVVHQPTVEKVSEVGAKTVARPSGLLIGAVLSFTGSLIAYILTKQYGYELPNSIFSALFVGGFAIGIIGEFVINSVRSLKR